MTIGFTVPGSPVFQDGPLGVAVHCALQTWFTNDWKNSNWWYQWIGVPLQMSAIQIMLGENRTSQEEQVRLTQYSYDAAWWLNSYGGGDNLSDMAKVEGEMTGSTCCDPLSRPSPVHPYSSTRPRVVKCVGC